MKLIFQFSIIIIYFNFCFGCHTQDFVMFKGQAQVVAICLKPPLLFAHELLTQFKVEIILMSCSGSWSDVSTVSNILEALLDLAQAFFLPKCRSRGQSLHGESSDRSLDVVHLPTVVVVAGCSRDRPRLYPSALYLLFFLFIVHSILFIESLIIVFT